MPVQANEAIISMVDDMTAIAKEAAAREIHTREDCQAFFTLLRESLAKVEKETMRGF